MSIPPVPPQPRAWPATSPLDAALVELVPWWLEWRCGCRSARYMPFRLLASHLGWMRPLGSALPILKCEICRGKPSAVVLVDDPAVSLQAQRRIPLTP